MSQKLNRDAYEDLIAGNLVWLEAQPRTLERDHIIAIVKASADHEYSTAKTERDVAVAALASARADAETWKRVSEANMKLAEANADAAESEANLKDAARAELADARHDEQARIGIARVRSEREGFALGVDAAAQHVEDADPVESTFAKYTTAEHSEVDWQSSINRLSTEIRALAPGAGLVVVPRETVEKLKAKLGEALGDGHNLKAFAGTMLRWNEPGVDFDDEAQRVVAHAEKWHAEVCAALALLEQVAK